MLAHNFEQCYYYSVRYGVHWLDNNAGCSAYLNMNMRA